MREKGIQGSKKGGRKRNGDSARRAGTTGVRHRPGPE